ncbi:GLN3 (YER040W) [Zygosaccharomyces parabailii]|nr:GLN3 (YER040W) [Zygosaccharomyces parabailii]CDH17524.1 uncharacterized protein ZBAI_09312 [Zygosaccharomyces bailii ISA1307]
MPGGGNSDLHDIFDSTPPNGFTDDFEKENSAGSHSVEPGPFAFNSSTFDSMLEMLPDDMDLSFSVNGTHEVGSLSNSQLHGDGLDNMYDSLSHTQPIDIASNHQSGEIAPLWDFKVEDFMMTPTPGDSAAISAPNSFNSSRHFHPDSAPSDMTLGNSSFLNHSGVGPNMNHLLGVGVPHANFESHSTSSSPRTDSLIHSGVNNNNNSNVGGSRPAVGARRSSSQFSRTVHTEDGGIALSSNNTTNSVRKNSLAKQLSSTSLSNFKRGSSSGASDLPKKTPLQCFNCKTFKTPLWRRDAQGNTLCNACGLFQKLHGTMRPLSLKSDVIKKRNTKKRAEKQAQQNNGNSRNNNSNKSGTKSNKQPVKRNARGSAYDNEVTAGMPVLAQSVSAPLGSFEMGLSGSPMGNTLGNKQRHPQQQQQQTPTEGLNPNNLMDHNNKLSNQSSSILKKSRRSSTSSNNSSSSKSSSRSVVPILPKPSPGAPQLNFNFNGSNSAGNSAASSPRVLAAGCNADSPMSNWQQGMYPSSAGKPGITIPRRKSSRNHSSSSSFMAASLQQLQQQHQKQDHSLHQQQFPNIQAGPANSTFSVPNSWHSHSQTSSGYSPVSTRSPKNAFELAGSPVDSTGPSTRSNSRKSHTSLLSQQLQNSDMYHDELVSQSQSEAHTPTGHPTNGGSNTATPQPISLKRSSVTASPRNSYADSLLQQRGIKDESGSSLRRQTSVWARKNLSLKDQVISSNAESMGGSNSASLAATPTVSTTATPATSGENSGETNSNIADELDWLKFGM